MTQQSHGSELVAPLQASLKLSTRSFHFSAKHSLSVLARLPRFHTTAPTPRTLAQHQPAPGPASPRQNDPAWLLAASGISANTNHSLDPETFPAFASWMLPSFSSPPLATSALYPTGPQVSLSSLGIQCLWGTWLAPSVEHAPLDLGVVSSSPP